MITLDNFFEVFLFVMFCIAVYETLRYLSRHIHFGWRK